MRTERCSAIANDGRVCLVCNACSHYGGVLEEGHVFELPGKNFNNKSGCDDYMKKEDQK